MSNNCHAQARTERRPVGSGGMPATGQTRSTVKTWGSGVRQRGDVAPQDGRAMARYSRAIRQLEDYIQPVRSLGEARGLGARFQEATDRRRRRLSHRRLRRPGAPGCGRRKRGVRCNALGRSRGGFSSKIHAITTTKGKPLHITLTAGQVHDAMEAEQLIEHATGKALVADAGYDADRIVDAIRQRGMKPIIAMNPTRKYNRRRKSRALYRLRGNVECFFHDLKRFRAIASRYEKTAVNFLGAVHVACIFIWIN